MDPQPTPTQPSAEAEASPFALAERWADFTRALAFYPDTNRRVQAALEGMRDVLATATAGPGGGREVYFHADRLEIGGEEIEVRKGTALGWLSERIHRAALVGVGFEADVPTTSLVAFTRRLLGHFNRELLDVPFEELWPATYPGLQLIERRFEGGFSGAPGEGGTGEGAGTDGTGGTTLDLAKEQDLADLLAQEDEIRIRLDRLRQRIDQDAPTEAGAGKADLLGRIVKLLPPDTMLDFESIVTLTGRILDSVSERLDTEKEEEKGLGEFRDDETLDKLLFVTSRGMLASSGPNAADVAVQLLQRKGDPKPKVRAKPVLRAADAAVEERVDLFFADLAKLPAPRGMDLTAENVQISAEQLGVYLHCLTRFESEESATRLHPKLERILADPSPQDLQVLKQYLEARWFATEEYRALYLERVVDFLREKGLLSMFRRTGILTHKVAKETFPEEFGLYLDCLDVADFSDLRGLGWVLQALGASTVLDARDRLVEGEGILEGDRLTRLFVEPQIEFAPLVHLVLEVGDEEQQTLAREYLHRLPLPGLEARLLRLFTSSEGVPRSILLALTQPNADGAYPRELRRDIVAWLSRKLHPEAARPLHGIRRTHSVELLALLDTKGARVTLKELLGARRMGLIPRESAEIRGVAREALERHKMRQLG